MALGRPAVFVDKDGTLVEDVPYSADPARMVAVPEAVEALGALARAGFAVVVVSNQSGVARGLFPESALAGVRARIAELLAAAGVELAGFYYCPHHPQGRVTRFAMRCPCRKPAPGMLLEAASDLGLDLSASWMVGDILDDVEAGRAAGCRTVLLDRGAETRWELSPARLPHHTVTGWREAAAVIGALSGVRARG